MSNIADRPPLRLVLEIDIRQLFSSAVLQQKTRDSTIEAKESTTNCLMKFLLTDIEISTLSLVLVALIAFIGWEILTANALRALLPRWLRHWLRERDRR